MKADSESYLALLEELLGKGRTVTTRVRGRSMLPAVADGAVVRVAPLSDQGARVGEVVATRDVSGKLLCHRVSRVYTRSGQTWVQTWGDTCHAPDGPVPAANVIGRVTALVEGEVEISVAPRPAWRLRGRYLKRDLRRLFGRSQAAAEPPICAVADSGGDDAEAQ